MTPRQAAFWRCLPSVRAEVREGQAGGYTLGLLRNRLTFATGAEDRPRTLIVAVAGDAGAVIVPVSRLLQALPTAEADVVVMMDPARLFYRNGIAPLGRSLITTINRLAVILDRWAYARCVVLSGSVGGSAAITIARQLRADRCVMLSPVPWPANDRAKLRLLGRTVGFNPACDCAVAPTGDLHAVYSHDRITDREMAFWLRDRMQAQLHPVIGETEHNFFIPFMARNDGSAEAFLDHLTRQLLLPRDHCPDWPEMRAVA